MPLDLSRHRKIDLHMHSLRSDGRHAPDEVLDRCARNGLDLVALTDHDFTTLPAATVRAAHGRELTVLAGAEISGMYAGSEYHLLVYFAGEVPAGFRAFCADLVAERVARYDDAVAAIGLSGIAGADDAARRGERALTRYHLAQALVAAGHARDLRDAFARYAGDAAALVPAFRTSFPDAIRVARSYGGLTSWAHPPIPALHQHLEAFVAAGLQGLEGVRPGLQREERRLYRKAAAKYGLYLTGGSDWHGWHDGDVGLFFAERAELAAFLDALQAAA